MTQHHTSVEAKVAVLTVSDTRSIENDLSGAAIVALLKNSGHQIIEQEIVQDELVAIATQVTRWARSAEIEAIIVTGGTGASPRDVTPDAITPLFSSTLPGFGELFRHLSYNEIGASAMLSRADAGWIDEGAFRTPVFLLPGSPKAVTLAVEQLIIPQLGHLLLVCRGGNTI